jgi:hypothetical protein
MYRVVPFLNSALGVIPHLGERWGPSHGSDVPPMFLRKIEGPPPLPNK